MKCTGLKRGKPLRADPAKTRAWQDRSRKPLARSALKRSGQPMRQRNPEREKKRHAHYRAVLASEFHKRMRYEAWQRTYGLCECEECAGLRGLGEMVDYTPEWRTALRDANTTIEEFLLAWTPVPVWFTTRGGEPWKRFRSTDGEAHHTSYRYFGEENPEELGLLRWMWKAHHRREEARHGTRRAFLRGSHATRT